MALTKFAIAPNQSGYSVKDGKETLSAKLDGGTSRYRRDVLNSSSMVNVQWTLNQEEFRYFRAFYNGTTVSGSLPFLIDLVLDLGELTEHEAYFVPDSVQTNQVVATQNFTVSAQLEVKPTPEDAEHDSTLVMLYNEYGSFEEADAVLNQLETLTNVDLPGSLPG
jgi:hypothetical protein